MVFERSLTRRVRQRSLRFRTELSICVWSVDRWSCPKSIFHIFPFPITEGISHLLPSCCNSLSEYFLATSVHDPLIKKYTRTSVCTVRDKICTPVWIVRRNGCANMCPACTLGLMMCPSSSKVNGNDSVAANVNVVLFLQIDTDAVPDVSVDFH